MSLTGILKPLTSRACVKPAPPSAGSTPMGEGSLPRTRAAHRPRCARVRGIVITPGPDCKCPSRRHAVAHRDPKAPPRALSLSRVTTVPRGRGLVSDRSRSALRLERLNSTADDRKRTPRPDCGTCRQDEAYAISGCGDVLYLVAEQILQSSDPGTRFDLLAD
jgi:hypothetical protein